MTVLCSSNKCLNKELLISKQHVKQAHCLKNMLYYIHLLHSMNHITNNSILSINQFTLYSLISILKHSFTTFPSINQEVPCMIDDKLIMAYCSQCTNLSSIQVSTHLYYYSQLTQIAYWSISIGTELKSSQVLQVGENYCLGPFIDPHGMPPQLTQCKEP